MIEIWTESARFDTKSQILAYQARIISNKGSFPELEVLEICGYVSFEEYEQSPLP